MADETKDANEKSDTDTQQEEEARGGSSSGDQDAPGTEEENKRPEDTLADEKKCPECGAPVDDVRATCINCGYEYSDEDHEDLDAGSEFVTGSQIDDEGNELPDDDPPPDSEVNDGDDDEKKDEG